MSEPGVLPPPSRRNPIEARAALARKFSTPEERSEFYRHIGARGNAGRLTMPAEDVRALGEAYALLSRLAAKYQFDPVAPPEADSS
jgi:hypothetical protein